MTPWRLKIVRNRIGAEVNKLSAQKILEIGATQQTRLGPEGFAVRLNSEPKLAAALENGIAAKAEQLPFADETFDLVISQFLLCSVELPLQVGEEIARVLVNGGCYVCVEHLPSPHRWIAGLQRAVQPVGRHLLGWCRISADNTQAITCAELVQRRSLLFSDWHEPIKVTFFAKLLSPSAVSRAPATFRQGVAAVI